MDVKSPVKSHISEELFNVHVHNRLNQTGSLIIRSFSVWFPVFVWCFLLLRLRIFSAAFGLQTVPHYSCRMSGRGTKRHFIQDRLNRNRPVCWDGLKCIMGLRPIRSDQIRSSGLPRIVSVLPGSINWELSSVWNVRTRRSFIRKPGEFVVLLLHMIKEKKNQSKVLDDDLSLHHADCI